MSDSYLSVATGAAQQPCDTVTPLQGAPATEQPLKVCASLDKSSYKSSDLVMVTITVTNTGTGTASGLRLTTNDKPGSWNPDGFSPTSLLDPDNGKQLAPGETITETDTGYASQPASGQVEFTDTVLEANPNSPQASEGAGVDIFAPVTVVTGDFAGTVVTTAGTPLSGVKFSLFGPFNGINSNQPQTFTATSDSDGKFRIANLQGGRYVVSADAPAGWIVSTLPGGIVVIDGSGSTAAESFTARRPQTETLSAKMTFDQPSYHIGEQAHLTITLTNRGTTDLTGVQASCDNAGEPNLLLAGKGWGALNGDGVTVPAGKSVTEHVSTLVPITMSDGTIGAGCIFGQDVENDFSGPQVFTQAKALSPAGPTIDFSITLRTAPQNGLVGAPMFLRDTASGDPIFWTLQAGSDNPLTDVPEGTYTVDVEGGWQLAPGAKATFDTHDLKSGGDVVVDVVPRDSGSTPPTSPPTSTTTTGAGSTTTKPGTSAPGTTTATTTTAAGVAAAGGGSGQLAFTGVDVFLPVLIGLVLIAAGVAVVLLVRRRRALR